MEFIKKYFLFLVIAILVLLLFLGRCSKKVISEAPIIKHDTVWVKHDSIITSKPLIIYTKPPPPEVIKEYLPDTNYNKLVIQYNNLLTLYLNKNTEKDSLKLDSLGYVYVTDIVYKNLIDSRSYHYNIKYPKITTTITLPAPKKNQIYIGGALEGNTSSIVNQLNAGFLLKNRKDQIYGVYSGINKDGQLQFGIQSYWKISF